MNFQQTMFDYQRVDQRICRMIGKLRNCVIVCICSSILTKQKWQAWFQTWMYNSMFHSSSCMFCYIPFYPQPHAALNHVRTPFSHDTSGISMISPTSGNICYIPNHSPLFRMILFLIAIFIDFVSKLFPSDTFPRCLGRLRRSCVQGVPKPNFSSAAGK